MPIAKDNMNISLSWLKEFIQLDETPEQLAQMLTMAGLEVEGIEEVEQVKGGLKGLVIGEVLTCERHPNADKLSLTTVDVGSGTVLPIVCGAPNVAKGQKVVVATVGATLYPVGGEPFVIKKSKIRGEASEGMICAEDEIGLGQSHDGIIVLDTALPNGTPAAAYFQLDSDYCLSIGLTPNRADAASHYGVARDLRALTGRDLCVPSGQDFVPGQGQGIAVSLEDPQACPRYAGVTIAGLQIAPSPDWLQQRLRTIGLNPINNVVDITNYVLHGLGQPLHAFDADQIAGGKVVVRTVDEGTPFVTLDGQERKLAATDLMICDSEKPMCIGGVFGGKHSGVSDQTTRIFLESAYFDPGHIRKTSQRHGLKTDASFRFERGTDPDMVLTALRHAAVLICRIAGGHVVGEVVDLYPKPLTPNQLRIRYAAIDRLIGKQIDRQQIQTILRHLGIEILSADSLGLELSVPPFKVDVTREADIAEEVLRIFGFNNIPLSPHLRSSYLADFPQTDENQLRYAVAQLLAGSGAQEIWTNSLTQAAYSEKSGFLSPEDNAVIINRLSPELGVMRQSLLFGGLETIAYNINRRQTTLRLFEFGRVYRKSGDGFVERNVLAIFVTGTKQQESWQAKTEKADFHALLSLVRKVADKLNVQRFDSVPSAFGALAYGLDWKQGKRTPFSMGLVKPSLAKMAGVRQEVFYAEIDWDDVVKHFNGHITYQPVSKFPEVRRDLSLVLDQQVTFDQLTRLAQKTEKTLLRQVNAFDVYEGPNLGEGKKAYALSFILQDESQTLTDEVIDKTMARLMQSFEKELGAVIRK